jgi:hypothetical protein
MLGLSTSMPRLPLLASGALFLLSLFLQGCSSGGGGSTNTITPPAQTTFYVDCSQSSDGAGTQSSPWNSLMDANSHFYMAGNSILFKRGTTCNGIFQPVGSGVSGSPIVVDAYGTGNLPILNGGSTNTEAVLLQDQSYWEINDLEIVGGVTYGVFVTGNTAGPLNHIYLRNLNVHNANGTEVARGDSGEVVLDSVGANQTLNDILIDGVTAGPSNVSEGILIAAGGYWLGPPLQTLGNNIIVQNSTAHDVGGDGILVTQSTNATMQNNVVYHTGLCSNCSGSSSGLWEWWCNSCTVQNNESYNNLSGDANDGGDFDIDFYDNNNIVQYNYGHDSVGYCVSVFGSASSVDNNSIIRYNVCSNDDQWAANAAQGEIFLNTWNGGALNGVQIYNNTIYFNPAAPASVLNTQGGTYTGSSPVFFENNIIYSAVPGMIATTSAFKLDYNLYWATAGASPQWTWNGTTYTSLADYQAASSQDAHSIVADPMLNSPTSHSIGMPTSAFTLETSSPAIGAGTNVCFGISQCTMGTQDFFGNPLPANDTGYNIGAYQ